jgi:hypothetical protein
MISRNIDIVVTSVLQTTAGKMIFGRYIEAPPNVQAHAPVIGPTPVAAAPVAGSTAVSRAQNAK